MKTAFIIHGTEGYPEENWFSWLKKELEALGYNVYVPQFPTPENQSLDSWIKVFDNYKEKIDENTLLIGHSLGPAFILNLLEKGLKVKNVYFVSSFIGLLGNSDFDSLNKTFTDKKFDWKTIKSNCKHFTIFHSNDDPYVPIEKCFEICEKLNVVPIIINNAGHFNTKAGYTKFDLLLEKIKEIK